jgi:hypothetical protein
MKNEITRLRRFYAYLSIRRLLKKRELWSQGTSRLISHDSTFWIWYPLALAHVVALLYLGLYKPPKE